MQRLGDYRYCAGRIELLRRARADPRKRNTPTVIALAKAMTDDEVREAS